MYFKVNYPFNAVLLNFLFIKESEKKTKKNKQTYFPQTYEAAQQF